MFALYSYVITLGKADFKGQALGPMKKALFALSCVLFFICLSADFATAGSCTTKSSFSFVNFNTAADYSYCELCGYGYVTVNIRNPYSYVADPDPSEPATPGATINDIVLTIDLGSSGLSYAPMSTGSVVYSYNGGLEQVGSAPVLSGASNRILTFDQTQISALAEMVATEDSSSTNILTIRVAVASNDPASAENLWSSNKSISAAISFADDSSCTDSPVTADPLDLPLNEPELNVVKTGWNYDSGQRESSATNPVFATNNDDVVWRIAITNTGTADAQDVRIDDYLTGTSLINNYICATAASANLIANNDGNTSGIGLPGDCTSASNSIDNFIVSSPFGASESSSFPVSGTEIDVPIGEEVTVYVVGKVSSSAACSGYQRNTVNDVQWGCQADTPAGGILYPSSLDSSAEIEATADIYTRYNDGDYGQLEVRRYLRGVNTSQPLGARGTMTIQIRNYTGGSVKNIHIEDILPPEYVVDTTFVPTFSVSSPYHVSTYPGRVSRAVWNNPDYTDLLNNTNPDFDLTSNGDQHPLYADQVNMLRHGDVATLRFRVVLIDSDYYDRAADLDINPEEYLVTATDPQPIRSTGTVSNQVEVQFDTFCSSDSRRDFTLTGNGNGNPTGSTISARPEDLDVSINGAVFVLTNDPATYVDLPIVLTNNGGHDAADYHLYVTLGPTIEVVTPPAECSQISLTGDPLQPNPRKVWIDPLEIHATANVFECTSSSVIAPGASRSFVFETRKSTDPTDIALDDLTLRADVIGEITLADGTALTVPTTIVRDDGEQDPANNYSLDTTWSRAIGFNLIKTQVGTCNEHNPPILDDDGYEEVQIGEECDFHIRGGGWFGFETPGFEYISVQNINIVDEIPDGQAYLTSNDPMDTSTALIAGITLSPTDLTAPDERQFDWTFNVPDSQRIETPDEWFEVDVKTRILNKSINARSAPNYHAQSSTNILDATFDARFKVESSAIVEEHPISSNTIGFPSERIRRVNLTVTDPYLTLVKEVCNESLYGTGPSCSNFTTVTDEGDAYSQYIYRITVTNEQERNGVQRAPAYDVVVTDTLDPSDYAYVIPFLTDGLDNDGDSASDGGDSGGEGVISNNIVDDGTPAQLTFSYTHSSPLEVIEPGSSVELYYRVDFDDDAAPLQTFLNQVSASYDSLAGESGSQTAPVGVSGELSGARVYTADPTSARVQMVSVATQPKEIIATAVTPVVASGSVQNIKIGEELNYRITSMLPVALFRNLTIVDQLPSGMSCVEAPEVDLDAAPYASAGFEPGGKVTPTCEASEVRWEFGDQRITNRSSDRFEFPVNFIAQVLNTAVNNDGDVVINGHPSTVTTVSYMDEGGATVSFDVAHVDVTVSEPEIEVSALFSVGDHDASDVVTVTVTATNIGNAPAYNLQILDNLDTTRFSYVGHVGGSDIPSLVDVTTFGANQPVFAFTDSSGLDVGASLSFTYEVAIADDVEPDDLLSNTLQAVWTSLPNVDSALNSLGQIGVSGSSTGMRNGTLPHSGDSINDYESVCTFDLTISQPVLSKVDITPTLNPTIGVHKQFTLQVALPEGVTKDLRITDILNASGLSYIYENNSSYVTTYAFQDILSINGAVVNSSSFNGIPADETSDMALWDIGEVVTLTEDDTSSGAVNPLIEITLYGRINNDLVTDAGDLLRNGLTVTYQNGATDVDTSLSTATGTIGVTEPRLHITKAVINVTSGKATDATAEAGDTLEYSVTMVNVGSSGATAYDINIVDTLPAGLVLASDFTPTLTVDGVTVSGFVSAPSGAPDGPLIWGRDNGDATLDLASGSIMVVTYHTQVLWISDPLGTISNAVTADWTSLNGIDSYERTGEGCPAISAPNDYCAGPVTAEKVGLVPEVLFQMTVANETTGVSPAIEASPGDVLRYTMTINNISSTVAEFYLQNVIDELNSDPRFMRDSLVVYLPSGSGVDYSDPEGGSDETGIVYIDEVSVDPGDTLTISFTARLASVIADGSLVYSQSQLYIFGYGAVLSDDPEVSGTNDPTQITITSSPEWLFTKTSEDLTNSSSVLMPGDQIHYEMTIQNIGSEDASGVTLTDTIPAHTSYVPGTTTLNGAVVADVSGVSALTGGLLIHAPVPGITDPGVMVVEDTPNTATVTFDVVVDADAVGGTVISNQAFLAGNGTGSGSFVDIGSDDPDTGTANDATEDIVSDFDFELSVYNLTSSASGSTATPGDQLQYTLRLTNTSSVALNNLTVSADLDSLHSGEAQYFAAGSLSVVSLPTGADASGTAANGGVKGSGLLQVVLDLAAGATVDIVFDVGLQEVITDGTVILNQAQLAVDGHSIKLSDSDDSSLAGSSDPTETVITSSPQFQVEKVDAFIDEEPGYLLPGERIEYTITVKNIGTEDAENVVLTDYIPSNTTYVADSTTLNGTAVADVAGQCPLVSGLSLQSALSSGSGNMAADATDTTDNVATVTFQVLVADDAMIGLIITNQAQVDGDGVGSGVIATQLSDDPDTVAENDPTLSIVGNVPLLYAYKSVELLDDNGTVGIVDPGDTLSYTITVSNSGAKDAADVVLTDIVPTFTTYVSGDFTVDGVNVPDSGYLPLIDGLVLTTAGATTSGTINAGTSVTVSFTVRVNADAAEGSLISNQGTLSSADSGDLFTDADGDASNGYQATEIVVGAAQRLGIVKTLTLVDSSAATPGSELEYSITVTNQGSIAATDVSVIDDLSALVGSYVNYVTDSVSLNGSSAGVVFTSGVLTADYSDSYGNLGVGESFTLTFHVTILNDVALGTTLTNTATVYWNSPAESASASVSIDVGGTPGAATLNGNIWHDADFDALVDTTESVQQDWTVDLYLDGDLIKSVTSDEAGMYQINGLVPTAYTSGLYEIVFSAPAAGTRTAALGEAASIFTNDQQRISDISAGSGSNLQDLNMPLTPNGVIYNSIARTPVSGATVNLVNPDTSSILPSDCFVDAAQYNQLTTSNGYYKFDLVFGSSCPANRNYIVQVTAPGSGYLTGESLIIPAQSNESTASFDVTSCPANASQDAILSTAEYCEINVDSEVPDLSVSAGASETNYHLNLIVGGSLNPGHRQVFNNPIPLDPLLDGAVAISKVASLKNVSRGGMVPYTITVTNIYGVPLESLRVIDQFPAGFKYVSGSAQIDGVASEPERSGRTLTWDDIDLSADQSIVLRLLLVVGSGVGEGEYVNRARVENTTLDMVVSGEATATVRVIPDPDFDCSDVIGKVFDDRNLNGFQDPGEDGLSGVRIATAQGLIITTDSNGRYHLTCATVPDQDRGSNFIMKLDDRSLPTGYRVISENPRVQRLTRGKAGKFNFAATLHRVVQLDLSDDAFVKGETELRIQWQARVDELVSILNQAPAVLRLAYLGDVDKESLVKERLEHFRQQLEARWSQQEHSYQLSIETEIFWRRGTPP